MGFGELKGTDASLPNPHDIELAKEASKKLIPLFQKKEEVYELEIRADKKGKKEKVTIPLSAFSFLFEILKQMAGGNAMTLIPYHAQLTTQEAANFLNVSRPFLIKLLEEGKISFTKVGRHRRVQFDDILEYKNKIAAESEKAKNDLAKDAQDLNLGY